MHPQTTTRPVLTFGEVLTKQMELLPTTARVLATKVRAAEGSVRDWMRDRAYPSKQEFSRLCLILGRMRHYENLIPKDRLPPPPKPEPPKKTILTLVPQTVWSKVELAEPPTIAIESITITEPKLPPPAPPVIEEKKPEPPPTVVRLPVVDFNPKTFREGLRLILKAEGAKNTVAELLEITTQRVSWWEIGQGTPSPEQYKKLLDLFPLLARAPVPSTLRKVHNDFVKRPKPLNTIEVELEETIKPTVPPPPPLPGTAPPASIRRPVMQDRSPPSRSSVTAPTSSSLSTKSPSFTLIKAMSKATRSPDIVSFVTLLAEAKKANLTVDELLELLQDE
jgi:transcriptional regulator with XRE-family HTH domain